MVMIAFLGFFASKAESKLGLVTYALLSTVLMANLIIFTILLNYSSKILQSSLEAKCFHVMPYFHKYFYEDFGC